MIKIEKFVISNNDFASGAFNIRRKVFVEEQKVSSEDEFDEFENISEHYLAFYNEIPVGTARWRHTLKGIKLERFAVLEEYRSKKIGSHVLKEVLRDVIPLKKKIYLHAQLPVVNFYKREEFTEEGNVFYECDIAHYSMSYNP